MAKRNFGHPDFRRNLIDLINSWSIENDVDLPDHVIADYLIDQISALDKSMLRIRHFANPSAPAAR